MTEMDLIMDEYLQEHFVNNPERSFKRYVEHRINDLIMSGEFEHPYNIYKRGNIDRRVHSKLKKVGDRYRPTKVIALAYCIALGLTEEEAEDLLYLAGYHFEDACLNDQIVKCCLEQQVYSASVVNTYIYRFSEVYGMKPTLVGSFPREA